MPTLTVRTITFTASLLAIAAIASAHLARRSTIVNSLTKSVPSHSSTNAQGTERVADDAPSSIQVVLLTLRSEGFEPTQLQLSAGEYLLVVRNRTGLANVSVRLEGEAGERLGQAIVGRRQRDWKQRLRLTPGVYLLSETDHPDWSCRVVVNR